ncbi:16S rRNA pseudouridine(516) synthase [Stenoxybacter acetivorans]|uniref:16S rRNA pseudouridine(516) synthase n=1 Tax=Stenoxybacter acetivorans TaxID=422441 RepID=UPI00055C9804|nr:16S rRNA pseudouridine(516) synthase [Stenoxybacter acetivorans]
MNIIKYLQAQGLGSRKQCTQLIQYDLIAINGCLKNNTNEDIAPNDVVALEINGEKQIPVPYPFFYILLNKPADYETSHKPKHYPSVFSLLPPNLLNLPMQAVGRLDADTTGVLIITNDGQFNHRITSPKHKVPKRYRAVLKHAADERLCAQLRSGVLLHDDNETVCAEQAELADAHTLIMVISNGKYHQVKRMVAAAGNRVEQLHREQFGAWRTDGLSVGEWRFFQPDQLITS